MRGGFQERENDGLKGGHPRSALDEAESRDRLARANEELRRLDTAKSEFISLASHQLRTPVTVVRGYASEIKGGSLGPVSIRMAEGLDRLLAAARQLSRLVDDLLDLSRIETGRMHYEFKLVRLEEVVRTVLRELEIRAKQKGISLRFQDRNAAALLAVADSQKIQEVVTNLVDNAIAYSSKGTVDIELRPGEIQAEPTLVLSVTDGGLGIRTKDLPRLIAACTLPRRPAGSWRSHAPSWRARRLSPSLPPCPCPPRRSCSRA